MTGYRPHCGGKCNGSCRFYRHSFGRDFYQQGFRYCATCQKAIPHEELHPAKHGELIVCNCCNLKTRSAADKKREFKTTYASLIETRQIFVVGRRIPTISA